MLKSIKVFVMITLNLKPGLPDCQIDLLLYIVYIKILCSSEVSLKKNSSNYYHVFYTYFCNCSASSCDKVVTCFLIPVLLHCSFYFSGSFPTTDTMWQVSSMNHSPASSFRPYHFLFLHVCLSWAPELSTCPSQFFLFPTCHQNAIYTFISWITAKAEFNFIIMY